MSNQQGNEVLPSGNSNVSNLSTALKSVHINGNNITTTDQSYIDFGNIDQQQLQEQQQHQTFPNTAINTNLNTHINRVPQQQASRSPQSPSLFRNNGSPTTTYMQQRAGSLGNNAPLFLQNSSYTPQQPSRLQQQIVHENNNARKFNEERENAAKLQQDSFTNQLSQAVQDIDN